MWGLLGNLLYRFMHLKALYAQCAEPNTSGIPNQNARFYLLDTDGQMQHLKGSEIVNLSNDEALAIHQVRRLLQESVDHE